MIPIYNLDFELRERKIDSGFSVVLTMESKSGEQQKVNDRWQMTDEKLLNQIIIVPKNTSNCENLKIFDVSHALLETMKISS